MLSNQLAKLRFGDSALFKDEFWAGDGLHLCGMNGHYILGEPFGVWADRAKVLATERERGYWLLQVKTTAPFVAG